MQHALIVHVSIEFSKPAFLFINHLSHSLSCISLVNLSSLVACLSFSLKNIALLLLHLLLHSHLVCHEVGINFGLLHQILKTLLLKQSLLHLLLLFLRLFVKFLLLALHVCELLIATLPKNKHFTGQFLRAHHALFCVPLSTHSFLLYFIHASES